MEGNIAFLQDIQDAYAKLAELTVVITDVEGNEITTPSGINPLTKIAFEQWGSKEIYQSYINPIENVQQVAVIVNPIGLKLIVSPIQISGVTKYFVFAGLILRASTRTYVNEYIQNNSQEVDGLSEALNLTSEQSESEIKAKIELIQKLSKMVETFLTQQNEKNYDDQESTLIYQSLEAIRAGSATTTSFLKNLYNIHHKIDFIGLAIEKENDQYLIETIYGEHTEKLKGHTFIIGEGFLGHTIATEQFQFWQNVHNDPRTHFFKRNDLDPKSLFCVPVYNGDQVIGILFGGSINDKIQDVSAVEPFKMYTSILNTIITSNHLNQNLQNHLMELATFNEIFRVITTVKDMKRVLYILVDISINITRGPFACIVFKPEFNHSKVDIVSRGLSSSEINDYCYSVAVSAFSNTTMDTNIKQPNQRKTNWGTDVLEFPLVYNKHLFGILCVGLNPKDEPEKYQAFLSTLSVAGSISFHLCQNDQAENSDDANIQVLQAALSELNKEKHLLSIKIKNLIEEFTNQLNDADYSHLKKVCGLISYDFDFLKSYIKNKEQLTILAGCHNVLQNHEEQRRDSQLLAMIYKYVTENEKPDTILEMVNVDEELRGRFVSFINQQSIVETELSFDNTHPITKAKPKIQKDEKNLLKKELNLSSREIDVLNHILKGYNNREIAGGLFISEHTVKNHITKILQKLDVQDRAQAIAKVYQLGYSPPN